MAQAAIEDIKSEIQHSRRGDRSSEFQRGMNLPEASCNISSALTN